MLVSEIVALVEGFKDPADGSAMKSRELILQLLQLTESPFSRNQFTPGHITCTGLVFSPGMDAVLMVHHARLNRWLLPGGHVEAEDESAIGAARREVVEETAAQFDEDFAPHLVGMDVHGIPGKRGEPYHLHHDLIVAFRARTVEVQRSEESFEVRWVAESAFIDLGVPDSIALSWSRVLRKQRR